MRVTRIGLVGVIVMVVVLIATAQPGVAFTQGKTLRIIVGSSPGGGFDIHARTLARHIVRYLPGSPKAIVQDMPGGSGVRAANYLYNVAKPDGLTILASIPVHVQQLIGRKAVKYDLKNVRWIGSTTSEVMMSMVRTDSPYKNLDAIKASSKPPNFGYGSAGGISHQFGALLNTTLGLKVHLITGYRGTSRVKLAVEHGELDGFAGTNMTAAFSALRDWLQKNYLTILVQSGYWDPKTSSYKRHPRLKNVPTIWELAAPEHRRLINLVNAGQVMGRPYIAPPNVPEDRIKILRDAFWTAVNSDKYKKEAKRIFKISLDPVRGEVLEKFMKNAMTVSPQDVALLKKLIKK